MGYRGCVCLMDCWWGAGMSAVSNRVEGRCSGWKMLFCGCCRVM